MTAPYQLLPDLTEDERRSLRDDIADRGVLVPIEVDEDGNVLDGHHRKLIADELGVSYETIVRAGLTEPQKVEHALALNVHRRHLNRTQRRELVAKLRANGLSTRAIAEAVKINQATVVRDLAEAPGDASASPAPGPVAVPETKTHLTAVPKPEKKVKGRDGKTYSAAKPKRAQAESTVKAAPKVKETGRAAEKVENAPDEQLPRPKRLVSKKKNNAANLLTFADGTKTYAKDVALLLDVVNLKTALAAAATTHEARLAFADLFRGVGRDLHTLADNIEKLVADTAASKKQEVS